MLLFLLFALLLLFIMIRFPIYIAIGCSCLVYIVGKGDIQLHTAVQRMVSGVNAYTLLAIPFFILAGNIMNHGGISTRIFNFAYACVGHIRGGLAHVNIFASIIFAGMSGAAVADAGGLGSIEIKAMREKGYGERVTIGITAASSLIGPIIPPSMPLVIYGVAAGASIGRLFAAGVVPGLIMGGLLMLVCYIQADRLECPREPRATWRQMGKAFVAAFPSLMAPVIILGGIFTGWFTATESAAVACLYAFVLGVLYGDMHWKNTKLAIMSSMTTTIQILMIVASATLFAYLLAREQVPQQVAAWVLSITDNRLLILLMLNITLLLVGLFMETVASINLLVPVCLPLFSQLDIDPVHFGIIMVLNLVIGTVTPPFGSVLFVLSSVSRVPVEQVARYTFTFMPPLIFALALINLFPGLSLWLPSLFFGAQ